jgi:hypothetical protein
MKPVSVCVIFLVLLVTLALWHGLGQHGFNQGEIVLKYVAS